MCMCGDLYCSSCGPAQGNHKCDWCGKWSIDGGCDKPELCNKQLELMYKQWEYLDEQARSFHVK